MRYWLILFLFTTTLHAQQIDTTTVTNAAQLIGLDFTPAEKDSMIDGLKENRGHYEKMHRLNTPNNLAYPFTFNPAPPGYPIPVKQIAINWNIPANISLPQRKTDLAF